ncbi:MAG: hypothetical protein KAQ68_10965 [Clostridiales bacterium]|nr:hypothetical protein [Clostridiales bacterium]
MKKILICILALLLIFALLGCEKSTVLKADNWDITIVDAVGNVGEYSSIAVDSNNKAHIAYFENLGNEAIGEESLPYGNLKYATNVGGDWETTILDTYSGMTPRITVDKDNYIHIVSSKLGASNPENLTDLRYTTNNSGEWVTESIKAQVVKGSDASIVVDSKLNVHICAYNNEGAGTTTEGALGGLRYITNTMGEWTWVDVDTSPSAGNDGDIAIDRSDFVHISYLDKNKGLKYATNVNGTWELKVIDSTSHVGWNTSIAIDSNNDVHISYSDPANYLDPPGNGYLKYATNISGAWRAEMVDKNGVGFFTGLDVDSNDKVHIAYYAYKEGEFTGRLMYATGSFGNWDIETVDDKEFVGIFCAIDIDNKNNPHISHYDYIEQGLRVAKLGDLD